MSTLESYSLERPDETDPRAVAAKAAGVPDPIKIIIKGQAFFIRAVDPTIMIGELELKDFEILSDLETIIGYLYETPTEGAIITLDYGAGVPAEMPEPFTITKLPGGGVG